MGNMGRTNLSLQQVEQLVRQMRWNGVDYDILRHNCISFSSALCERLVGCAVPGWVDRFPHAAALAASGLSWSGFVDMCVRHIPSPLDNAKTKVEHCYTGP